MHQTIFAIDIGTTAIKFDLYDQLTHARICREEVLLETTIGENGEAYQDVREIIGQIEKQLIQSSEDYRFDKVVFSTAMHTLIPIVNDSMKEMYLWSDNQANHIAERLKKTSFGHSAYLRTGTPIHPMNPFCKIVYFKEEQTDFYQRVTRWSDLKAVLMAYFCGEWVTDYANASASGLFNSEKMCWDEAILAFSHLDPSQLPKVVNPRTEFNCSKKIKEKNTGRSFKVVIGASDGCLASYASSQTNATKTTLTVGTSGAVRVMTTDRKVDNQGRYFCYCLDQDHWIVGGPTNNGGKVLSWLSQLLYQSDVEIFKNNRIEESLLHTIVGAKNLHFYPYVFGERAPLWTGKVKASFEGLNQLHSKEDLVRSGIEGILFNLIYIARSMGINEGPLAISGGFFSIPGILQVTADAFQQPLLVTELNEPSYGAFLLTTQSETHVTEKPTTMIYPNADLKQQYQESYQKFARGVDERLS